MTEACNDDLYISNNIQTLSVLNCTATLVTFKLSRDQSNAYAGSGDHVFEFDFRYYKPYHSGG